MKDAKHFKTMDFSEEEFRQIAQISKRLIARGYFTGFNMMQSDKELPHNSVIVHFLHDSREHINNIERRITREHIVVPRFTFYPVHSEYFNKKHFKTEYENAIFYDDNFLEISIENAIKKRYGISVGNTELDLLIPLVDSGILEELIRKIKEADEEGFEHWNDPVIIAKTDAPVKLLDTFTNKYFASISRKNEEAYAVLTDEKRMNALSRYLDTLCAKTKIGRLCRSDIVFSPSQVNEEFARYLTRMLNPLQEMD